MFNLDLSEYENQDLLYSFILKDIANNTFQTPFLTYEIDTIPPVINHLSYSANNDNSLNFYFNITEKNIKDISFFDNSVKRSRWRTLCSTFLDGICYATQRFSPGDHNLTIKVSDRAGNYVLRDF